MSKIALEGNAGGTGTFTITSPNSNNNRTLNLPDSSGTMLTTGDTIPASQGGTGLTSPGASGNILTSDGTNWTSAAPASSYVGARSTIYTSGTNTFTIPAGITALKVTVIGGGGGGGGARLTGGCLLEAAGGGGGGGGFSQRWITGQTPGATVTVTVGAGGAGSTGTGGTGGTSSFGALASATGGSGGTAGNAANYGSGGANGTGSSGNINISGFRPYFKNQPFLPDANTGGYAGLYGIGGTAPVNGNGNGGNADGYGGGGGGARDVSNVQRTGGNGASGIVIIEY